MLTYLAAGSVLLMKAILFLVAFWSEVPARGTPNPTLVLGLTPTDIPYLAVWQYRSFLLEAGIISVLSDSTQLLLYAHQGIRDRISL